MDFGTMCLQISYLLLKLNIKTAFHSAENLSIPGGFSHQQPVLVKTNGCHRRETGEAGTRAAPDQTHSVLCIKYNVLNTKYTLHYVSNTI